MTYGKFVSAVLAVSFLGSALAGHAQTSDEVFDAMDINSDGTVSRVEFVEHMVASGKHSEAEASAKFARISGGDGQLTLAEYRAAQSAPKEKDHDGQGS